MGGYSCSAKAIPIWFSVLIVLIGSASSQNPNCPFDFLFHLGDGAFDIGNAIRRMPSGPNLPATKLPYGETSHTTSEGRWSDGYLDLDYGGAAMGFPDLKPYLAKDSVSSNGVIFAVARSPVLDRDFFGDKVRFPDYAAPLSVQLSWFKKYLGTVGQTPADWADVLGNSLFLMGDVEANDIAFPLINGISDEQVRTYAPYVTEAQISAAREVIQMGARRVIFTGNVPLGCYPYIQTKLGTNNQAAYDDLGCLESVNKLVRDKNKNLQDGINGLRKEFPNIFIYYADFYEAVRTLLQNKQKEDCYGKRDYLKACCGIGGKYNYNHTRFCGSAGVPVCEDPDEYIFWDGIHLTDKTNLNISKFLKGKPMETLNCTTPESWTRSIKPKKDLIAKVSSCGIDSCGVGGETIVKKEKFTITETWFGIKTTVVVAFAVALVGTVVYYKRII